MDLTINSIPDPEAPVLVIGGAGIDIIGSLTGELMPGSSTPAHIRTSFGGVARNVAENLARLGHAVDLISVVGDDDEGERLLDRVSVAGVRVEGVVRSRAFSTGAYLGIVNAKGGLEYALDDMQAIHALTPEKIRDREGYFKEAGLLFIDANIPVKTLRTIMSLARKNHLLVCADPTSATLAIRLQPYLDSLFLITPNSREAAFFCRPSYETIADRYRAQEAAKHLVSHGVELAIITLAEMGLCYATTETSGYIPALHTNIVDPTGAGDALSAAAIFALLNEIPIDDAVRLGVSAASLTLGCPGAVVPDLSLEMLYDQLVI